MEDQIVTIFCLCDDYIRDLGHEDFCNVKWSTTEVMTCWVTAMKFWYGNIDRARHYLITSGIFSKDFTLSALLKRVHRIPYQWWTDILEFLQKWGKNYEVARDYLVDSFPVPVCHNIRINRCRLFQGEAFRGYNASKKVFFYGLKATVVTDLEGCPVRAILSPGREHDNVPFKLMDLDLPKGSCIYGDAAYEDINHENRRFEEEATRIIADRKSNSRRELPLEDYVNLKSLRKQIETTFSMITNLMPRKIHAVTSEGFELKVLGFVLAMAMGFFMI